MPKGRIGLSLSEDVLGILNEYGRTHECSRELCMWCNKPTRTQIVEEGVRLWVQQRNSANGGPRERTNGRQAGNVKSEPSPPHFSDCACVRCGDERLRKAGHLVGQLDPEVGQDEDEYGRCVDSEASARVMNSILRARIPEESILRDYDEEPDAEQAKTIDEKVENLIAADAAFGESGIAAQAERKKAARASRKAELGESVKGALPNRELTKALDTISAPGFARPRVPLSLIGDPVEREKRIHEMAEAEKANSQPLARKTVTPLPKPGKKGSK